MRVLAAFQHLAETWDDDEALARLESADDTAYVRLRRLLRGHWKRRRVVVVLDDFEQNLTLDANDDAQLGTTGLVRGLQRLLRGAVVDDSPDDTTRALPPNVAAALAKIEAMIREP